MFKRLLSIFGNSKDAAEPAILREVRRVVASQYDMPPRSVELDRLFRDYGRENGLQDELNYVEVIQRLEDALGISLPDEIVLNKQEVGMELIPADATPRWLSEIVTTQRGNAAKQSDQPRA